jgi:hypothetical protein
LVTKNIGQSPCAMVGVFHVEHGIKRSMILAPASALA